MAFSGLVQLLHKVEASADLSADQYKIVTIDGSGQLALAGADVGGFVLQDKPDAAGVEGTILLGGKGKVIAGGAISKGDELTSDAAGLAVSAAPAAGANAGVIGIALDDAVANDLVTFVAAQSTTQG